MNVGMLYESLVAIDQEELQAGSQAGRQSKVRAACCRPRVLIANWLLAAVLGTVLEGRANTMRSGHVMLLVVADVARGELGEGNSGANDSDRGGLCMARAVQLWENQEATKLAEMSP